MDTSSTTLPKITCLCPTRGRFETLRESISFFLLQDYPNKELLIFNNHDVELVPHPKLLKENVRVINAGSYEGKSMQRVYHDALQHISGDTEYIAIWDDDDMYFPWHLSSNIEKLLKTEKKCIRALSGYWQDVSNRAKDEYTVIKNHLEASMIVDKKYLFFIDDSNVDSQTFTHPHILWNAELSKNDLFFVNDEITANFRWNYGKKYHHLQSGGPHKNNETGERKFLRPAPVKHLFFHLLENAHQTVENGNIVKFTSYKKVEFLQRVLSHDIDKFEHIEKYPVWLYWNNPNPPGFIKICHQSIRENTYAHVNLISDEDLHKYDLPTHFYELSAPNHRADYLRIFLLNEYGGFWFDSDTFVVGDLDEYYFKNLQYYETLFPWEYNVEGNITTPLFGSKPFSHIFKNALNFIDEYLKQFPNIGWAGINFAGVLKSVDLYKHLGKNYFNGLPNIAAYGYNNNSIDKWDFQNLPNKHLNMIIFHWSQIGKEMSIDLNITENETLDDIKQKIQAKYPNFKPLFKL
jgi:hypothetical protein